jgi:site-specific DNA recombinase
VETTVRVNYGGGGRDRPSYRIYTCRTGKHLSRKAAPIDAYVESVVLAWAMSPDAADSVQDRDRPDYEPLKRELGVLQMRLTQMTEDFADGELTREQLRAGTERARTRIGEIEHQLARVDRSAVLSDLIADPGQKWASFSLERRRRAIDMLMTVTIMNGYSGRPGGRRFHPETVRVDLKLG